MTFRWHLYFAFISLLGIASTALGQPKGPQPWWPAQPTPLPFVHPLFTDDMVLQRDMQVPIWGWSAPGDTITVAVDGKPSAKEAVAGKDGKWLTKVGPFTAGGPHALTIAGTTQKAVLKNVLFGDVWLCSGQSNMNWPVRLSNNAEEEVVSSPEVAEPKHVRYGWAWNPIVNLYNKEGLPALTFRTDE